MFTHFLARKKNYKGECEIKSLKRMERSSDDELLTVESIYMIVRLYIYDHYRVNKILLLYYKYVQMIETKDAVPLTIRWTLVAYSGNTHCQLCETDTAYESNTHRHPFRQSLCLSICNNELICRREFLGLLAYAENNIN